MIEAAGSMLSPIVAIITTNARGGVEILETDVAISERYRRRMLNTWVKQALAHSGMSQAELARRLSATLRRSIDRAAVNKMIKNGRAVSADEMLQIARITGYPAPVEEDAADDKTIPLVGYVGAGSHFFPFADAAELGRVRPPKDVTETTVAVEIRGESLGPLFDAWLAYYDERRDPPTEDLIGRVCIVGLVDGNIVVKRLHRGQIQGTFTLTSNFDPPIYDAVVDWAAEVKQISPR